MKLSRVFVAIAMASVCSPVLAGGTSVGTLTTATQGTFVARDGKMIPAKSGQNLYAGDRVVTRDGAKAQASFSAGCSYAIAPTSMLSVAPSACSSQFASFAQGQEDTAAGAAAGTAAGITTTSIIIGVVALAAVAGGVAAATSNTRTNSTSP